MIGVGMLIGALIGSAFLFAIEILIDGDWRYIRAVLIFMMVTCAGGIVGAMLS